MSTQKSYYIYYTTASTHYMPNNSETGPCGLQLLPKKTQYSLKIGPPVSEHNLLTRKGLKWVRNNILVERKDAKKYQNKEQSKQMR